MMHSLALVKLQKILFFQRWGSYSQNIQECSQSNGSDSCYLFLCGLFRKAEQVLMKSVDH